MCVDCGAVGDHKHKGATRLIVSKSHKLTIIVGFNIQSKARGLRTLFKPLIICKTYISAIYLLLKFLVVDVIVDVVHYFTSSTLEQVCRTTFTKYPVVLYILLPYIFFLIYLLISIAKEHLR